MPEKLLGILLSESKNEVFDKFMALGESLDGDWFTEYFQSEHGDRNKLKQDFTPHSVCEIVSNLSSLKEPILDMCSGTGGLTIKAWTKKKNKFICIEFAERAIPILLFNLAIRNIQAIVFHGDALTKTVFSAYKVTPGEKYSHIEQTEMDMDFTCGSCITNPPYSLKWSGDGDFGEYAAPPKSKADYGFLLNALSWLGGIRRSPGDSPTWGPIPRWGRRKNKKKAFRK